jgi:hypothetical protein
MFGVGLYVDVASILALVAVILAIKSTYKVAELDHYKIESGPRVTIHFRPAV